MRYSVQLLSLFVLSVFIQASGCGGSTQKAPPMTKKEMKEHLIGMNHELMQNESKKIDEFVAAKGLKVERSESGLRYRIIKNGKDTLKPKAGMRIRMTGTLSETNGKVCQEWKANDPKTFAYEHGEMIRGIEEAISMMHAGDEAELIIPSHLGYGKNGDKKTIPPSATLYCKMKLIEVSKITTKQ